MIGVILAAGTGTRLGPAAEGRPKCMVRVGGIPIIDRMIKRMEAAAFSELIVVSGYRSEMLASHLKALPMALAKNATLIENPRFAEYGNFYSLLIAEKLVAGRSFVKFDADVVLDKNILPVLLKAKGPLVLTVDSSGPLGDEEMKIRVDSDGRVVDISKTIDPKIASGESIGIDRIDSPKAEQLFSLLRQVEADGETHEYYERAFQLLMAAGNPFEVADISGHKWQEVDTASDLAKADLLAQTLD